jgi:uncharacterized protein (DUF433 family)
MDQDDPCYKERISKDPAVMVGKPVIRGTRIRVELILEWLSGDPHDREIYEAYPEITSEDIQAALLFARDAVRDDSLVSRERREALAAARRRAKLAPANA